jgi:hypothetical protein
MTGPRDAGATHRLMRTLITPLVLLTASCGGDDPFSPTIENVAGTFEQPGETFLRDVPFVASRNQLQAEGTFAQS